MENTEDTKILMVVKEGEARAAYEEALRGIGVPYDVACSFDEVLSLSIENAYSGIMIDILTLIRSSKEEKTIAYDCINFYPSLRVKWDARQKSMNLSPLEQSFSADTDATLAYFIENRCKPFTARSLRRFNRKETFLSVLFSTSRDFPDDDSIKSFTVNISQGGAFVHTTQPFVKGQAVWLRFVETPDAEPLRAVVCWRIEWGARPGIPGIGVMFEFISEQQADELAKRGRL
jgi:Tfp pilus assembly protein PilZ